MQGKFDFDTITKVVVPNKQKIIDKLRKNAESLIKRAEGINTEVSGNWTYRRQNFADSAYRKKTNLQKQATALNRLADLWEIDSCPEILKNVRGATDFEAYYPRPVEREDGWYKDEYPALLKRAQKHGLTCKEDSVLFRNEIAKLSEIVLTPEQEKAIKLKEALAKVHTYNIQGFFPTPDEVIDKMFDYADLKDSHFVLEPSAGIGSIIDRIIEHGFKCQIDAVEQQISLYEILCLKGYTASCADIIEDVELERSEQFDRIIMNPPFEKGQDIDHVLHCYKNFLKEGGKLVSVMSAGVLSNSTKKYKDFREFVAQHGGEFIQLGQAFKTAFNSTGVSTIILILDK